MKYIRTFEKFENIDSTNLVGKTIEFTFDKDVDDRLKGKKGKITASEGGSVEVKFSDDIEYLNIDKWLLKFIK